MQPLNVWVVVPAAGNGSRMQSALPKQYLPFLHHTVIEHTLQTLLKIPYLSGVVVSLCENDSHFATLKLARNNALIMAIGGRDRASSVTSGLQKLLAMGVNPDDWVLVHDAARPCVTLSAIERLLLACANFEPSDIAGAILAMPASDTLKKANINNTIAHTVAREQIWQAHTPQCFRLGHLASALTQAQNMGATITDEASAIELLGGQVALVEDSRENIKITRPDDLALATFIAQKNLTVECVK